MSLKNITCLTMLPPDLKQPENLTLMLLGDLALRSTLYLSTPTRCLELKQYGMLSLDSGSINPSAKKALKPSMHSRKNGTRNMDVIEKRACMIGHRMVLKHLYMEYRQSTRCR